MSHSQHMKTREPAPKTTPCEQVAELLPWHVAGSRDPAEAATVEGHLATCAACRDEARDVAATWELLDVHAPAHDLVAVALDLETEDWSKDEVDAHLAVCSHCRDEFDTVLEAEAEFDSAGFEQATNVVPFRRRAISVRRVAPPLAIAAALLLATLSAVRLSTPEGDGLQTAPTVTASVSANGLDAQPANPVLSQESFESGLSGQWQFVAGSQQTDHAIHTQDFESQADLVVVREATSRDQT